MPTVRDALQLAGDGLDALATRGEAIEEEWQYVTDLTAAWRARLDEVRAARGDEPLPDPVHRAVTRAVEEADAIRDPHRAIDWLSTFPQIVLVALGEAG